MPGAGNPTLRRGKVTDPEVLEQDIVTRSVPSGSGCDNADAVIRRALVVVGGARPVSRPRTIQRRRGVRLHGRAVGAAGRTVTFGDG
jgi:hypothetical protein